VKNVLAIMVVLRSDGKIVSGTFLEEKVMGNFLSFFLLSSLLTLEI
jgi:hypothetical protein